MGDGTFFYHHRAGKHTKITMTVAIYQNILVGQSYRLLPRIT